MGDTAWCETSFVLETVTVSAVGESSGAVGAEGVAVIETSLLLETVTASEVEKLPVLIGTGDVGDIILCETLLSSVSGTVAQEETSVNSSNARSPSKNALRRRTISHYPTLLLSFTSRFAPLPTLPI
jgi:hypothetical protein